MVVQAAALYLKIRRLSVTKTPFLPFRFPTPIRIPTKQVPEENPPAAVEEEQVLPSQNEPDPALAFPPDYYQIEGVVTYPQWFTLDCEARTAVDWAAFFGYSIDNMEFLGRHPPFR